MARSIYSTRFLVGTLNTAAGFTRTYVVPAGKVAVIRQLTADIFLGPATFQLALSTLPGPVAVPVARWATQATGTLLQWETRIVVNAGESITIANITAAATVITAQVSGYLLTV